jgi:succinate dehydrogenase/fumarate reductase flavoprotein subunit
MPALMTTHTDVLVLGGGFAGHRAAIAARQAGADVVLASIAKGASSYVLGCNAPLGHEDPLDSQDRYIEDMISGGYGLNDRRLVQVLAENAAQGILELAKAGVPFARSGERFRQRHLSGNSHPRSVYVEAGTGRAILAASQAMARDLGVYSHTGLRVIALLQDGGEVCGAILTGREGQVAIHARAVVLATGGVGRLYGDTTYPADVGADSFSLALEAGATLIDMEFIQFEPTIVLHPKGCKGMEMPTAMLGDGAHILNADGERFMFRHNPDHGEKWIEKARLSLCIQEEIDAGRGVEGGTVHFDTTALTHDVLEGYVTHCARLRKAGLDPRYEMPRVRPAAHSIMGGIAIDETGWTGVPGLYAAGEATGGVHGASRIAGNGGTDALVFGAVAGRNAARGLLSATPRDRWSVEQTASQPNIGFDTALVEKRIRNLMDDAGGLYRTEPALKSALDALADLEPTGLMRTAECILHSALIRIESRGAHQRRDYPERDDSNWLHHVALNAHGMTALPIR